MLDLAFSFREQFHYLSTRFILVIQRDLVRRVYIITTYNSKIFHTTNLWKHFILVENGKILYYKS